MISSYRIIGAFLCRPCILSFRGRRPRNLGFPPAAEVLPNLAARDDGEGKSSQRDVPVLLGRQRAPLPLEERKRGDQLPARLRGLDDLVDEAVARGDVGVREVLD